MLLQRGALRSSRNVPYCPPQRTAQQSGGSSALFSLSLCSLHIRLQVEAEGHGEREMIGNSTPRLRVRSVSDLGKGNGRTGNVTRQRGC
jgi:hypothetical protein